MFPTVVLADTFAQGDGTESNPYGISTPNHLNAVRNYPNAHFIMLNDIDLSAATSQGGAYWNDGAGWEPIGDSEKPFSGVIDGDGYKILNINITGLEYVRSGLFGYASGEIKNVHMEGGKIDVVSTDKVNVGSVVGYLTNGIVDNCSSSTNVSAQSYYSGTATGGIVGRSDQNSTILNSTNNGSVTGVERIGGIIGVASDTVISNCTNLESFSVDSLYYSMMTGGVVGYTYENVTISNCSNSGDISVSNTDESPFFGGIVGFSSSSCELDISECFNTGNILIEAPTDRAYAGGIVGYYSTGDITECYNTGNIDIKNRESFAYIGGIVGVVWNDATIMDCFNMGNMSSADYHMYYPFVGGIVGNGYSEDCAYVNCYNVGEIDGSSSIYSGGIAGIISGDNDSVFSNCYYADTYLDGIGDGVGTVTRKSLSVLKEQATFSGFNFTDTWEIVEGERYPVLQDVPFVYVTGVSIDDLGLSAGVASSQVLVPTVIPSNASNKNVSWESSDYNAVWVYNGRVTLKKEEGATITVTTFDGGFTDTCEVFEKTAVTDVTVSKSTLTLTHHETEVLTVTVLPDDATYPEVTWSSSDTSIAAVDQSGLITAVGPGEATITATADDVSDTCVITVEAIPVSSVTLSSESKTLHIDDTVTLTADVLPNDATYSQVTWSSSNTDVAIVDQSGFVTAVGLGETTITATADGVSDTCVITVEAIPVSSLTLSSGTETIDVGDTVTLIAEVLPDDATYPQVVWSSSNTDTATVDQSGLVTAVGLGEATITATADGVSDTCVITVDRIPVSSVTLSGKSSVITINNTITLTASVLPQDATNQDVTWSSSNTNIATVNQSGLITAVGLGEVTITATADGVSDTCAVTVQPQSVTRVILSRESVTMYIDDTVTLTAGVQPDDATYPQVTWSSSNTNVATINQSGVVTAVGIGYTNITATADGKSDTCMINVSIPTVRYQTHVQNVGWQGWKYNGEAAGTSGRSLRLEGMYIEIEDIDNAIEYRTHVQNIGWQDWVSDGEMTGTSGRSLRLEAIDIRLTGKMAEIYDIYYRVHAQNFGWMDWAKNGQSAGTAGYAYRLEAIEIVMVEKGGAAPGPTTTPFKDKNGTTPVTPPVKPPSTDDSVRYQTHVQNVGWQGWKYNGDSAGTSGKSLRLEGMYIEIIGQDNAIEYRTHVQNIGWQDWVSDGEMTGTSGRSLRLEAIDIRLMGEMADVYDVYYRVHAQNVGWMDWAKNGRSAGTAGFSYRLEAIQIVLVEKGGAAPGETSRPFIGAYES